MIASYSRQDIVVISLLNLQKSRSISPNIIPCSKIKANLRFLFYKHLFSAYTYVKVIAEKVIPHENYKVEPSGVPRNDICLIKVPSLRESSPPDCIGKCSKHFHPFAPDEQLADNNSTFFSRKKLKINIKKSSEPLFDILNFRMLRSCLPTTEFTSSQTWSTLLDSWMGKYSKGF